MAACWPKPCRSKLEPGNPASRRRLETQVLHYDVDTWKAYNYIWNDEQTDAMLATEGSDRKLDHPRQIGPQRPARSKPGSTPAAPSASCATPRGPARSTASSPSNSTATTTTAARSPINCGRSTTSACLPNRCRRKTKAWSSPLDVSAPLDSRARSYLHVNCGHCHRRGGGGSAAFDVQMSIPLDKARLVGGRPTQGTFGIHDAQLVAPGDPYRSVLYYRMMKLGHGRMPQFGSQVRR